MPRSYPKMYQEVLRRDLNAFIHRSFFEVSPDVFLPNWHIEVLAAKLEDVRQGRCKRLIVNVPPRHLKTHAISVAFPAWLLGHDPSKQILSVTYAQDLSEKMARDSRKIMASDFYKALFDTRISRERDSAAEFETEHNGYRLSDSVSGGLTGRGANLIILDDPLKPDDALSDIRRKAVNERYDNTIRTRLNSQNTGAIIIVMQRLHGHDLVAHVQQHEQWDVLSFPAIAEKDETFDIETIYGRKRIHRKAGSVLHPDHMSREQVDTLRRGMNAYNFSGQFQQDPQPLKGNLIERSWLKYYRPDEKPNRFDTVLQSWDTANKEAELSDYSVCTTWGIKDEYLYLLDVYRRKLKFPDLKRAVQEQSQKYGAKVVLVEDMASGTQLIQQLRSERFTKIMEAPKLDGNKTIRLNTQTPMFAGGFVLLPVRAPWLDDYVHELLAFPAGRNDDQVDSTVFALAWASQNRTGPFYTRETNQGLQELNAMLAFQRRFS